MENDAQSNTLPISPIDKKDDSKFRGSWSVRVPDPKPRQFAPPPLPAPPADARLNRPIPSVLSKYAPQLIAQPQKDDQDDLDSNKSPIEPIEPNHVDEIASPEQPESPHSEDNIETTSDEKTLEIQDNQNDIDHDDDEEQNDAGDDQNAHHDDNNDNDHLEANIQESSADNDTGDYNSDAAPRTTEEVDPERKEQKSQIKIDPNSTPLIRAVWDGDVEKARQILEQNPDSIHDRDTLSGTPVICLASQWAALIPMMKLLVEDYGANPNDKAIKIPMFPLGAASALNIVENLEYLLDQGALVNGPDENAIPLIIASQYGHLESIKYLIQRGADIHLRVGGTGNNAICQAARKGHTAAVEYLHSQGASLDPLPGSGVSPLLLASLGGHLDCVKWLVEHKALINGCAKDGASPVFYAVKNNHKSVVAYLASKGADLNLSLTGTLTTPLHLAVQKGNKDMVSILLENGAYPDPALSGGQTPLYIGTKYEHFGIVKLLLAAKADPLANCSQGRTPYSLALHLHAETIVTMMQEAIKNTPKKRSPRSASPKTSTNNTPNTPKTPTTLTRKPSVRSPSILTNKSIKN